MVKLDKLSICGIRSFGCSDGDIQTIKFSSPLTVILGQNGSGKTTIIEALRYACTGDLPEGSSKGQGFVHDPKLTGGFRVKGQVRLRLEDSKGIEYSVFKSCEVTQNLNSLTFKSKDNTLSIKKPNEDRKDISGRCADIEAYCKEILGVSPAIINNVILCHQENSNWPLSDGKKLKEKFDEIFDAVAYNRFCDHIRKLIKESKSELKVQEVRVSASKAKKAEAEHIFNTLNDCLGKQNEIENEIKEKQLSLEPIEGRIREILKIESELLQIRDELTKKENEVFSLKQNQEYILKNLDYKEFEGNDEDLDEEINSFNSNRKKFEERKKELETRKVKIEDEEKKINLENTKLQVKLGQLKQEKAHYEKLCEDGNALMRKLKDLEIHEANFNNITSVKRALNEIESNTTETEINLKELAKKFEKEDTDLQLSIDKENKQLTEIRQLIEIKQDLLKENEQKIRSTNFELEELCFSDEQINQLKNKIEEIETDLAVLNSEIDVNELTERIDQEKRKKRTLQDELNSLDKIYKILQQNNDTNLELDLQKGEMRKLESDLNKLRSKNFDNFNKLFGSNVPENGLKKSVEHLLQIEQKNYDDFLKNINKKEKDISTYTAQLAAEETKLENYRIELEKSKEQIQTLCKDKSLQKMLSDIEVLLEQQQKRKGYLNAANIIYEKFVDEFQKDEACCPLCKTDFTNKKEATAKIIQIIKTKINTIPNDLKHLEGELRKNQILHNKLVQLKPINEKIRTLTTDTIPKIENEVDFFKQSLERSKTELQKIENDSEEPKLRLNICRIVLPDAALIDQQKANLDLVKRKITDLESRLLKVPTNRTKQQVEMDMDRIKENIGVAEQNYESFQKKIEQFKMRSQQFGEKKNSLMEQQLQIQQAVQNKPMLEEQLNELKEKNEKLNEEIKNLQEKIEPLKNKIATIKNQKETNKNSNQKRLNEERKDLDQKIRNFQKLKDIQNDVESYLRKNVDALFDEAVENLKTNKTKLETLTEGKNKIAKAMTEINTQLATQDTLFKTLENNKLLRKTRLEEKRALLDLEKLKAKTGKIDHLTIDREKQKLLTKRQQLDHEIAERNGQKTQLLLRIADNRKELEKPENRDAHKIYKQECYKFAARLQAMEDLETYVKNFENVLMQFHTSSMKQVNERIRQLWREIYRGSDIDHIQIKTEQTGGTQTRRQYKYRVVQVKNGVEMDMSGRCSAGQKVLASIIIRLALAERFSINCGILALDEPTTNLDKENVVSLSNALVDIVRSRKREENFQLIVITHDEDFLQELKHVDGMRHYWKVSRSDRDTSIIQKIHI